MVSAGVSKTSGVGSNPTSAANKKVRRLLKDPEVNFDKGSFKKAYCSWDNREVAPSFEVFSERWLERQKRNRARLGRRNPSFLLTARELS